MAHHRLFSLLPAKLCFWFILCSALFVFRSAAYIDLTCFCQLPYSYAI